MWLHHEMCTELILNPQEISQAKMFGSYLHDLSSHAAQQYEIVCLRSVNAECQERLFGQVKRTTLNATNRRPQQVIPEVLLRLQMRQKQGSLLHSVTAKDSKVTKAAKHLAKYPGTSIHKDFLSHRSSSWQAHLEKVCNYLIPGPEVWWKEANNPLYFP